MMNRDELAQQYVAARVGQSDDVEVLAKDAYKYADAMIAASLRTPNSDRFSVEFRGKEATSDHIDSLLLDVLIESAKYSFESGRVTVWLSRDAARHLAKQFAQWAGPAPTEQETTVATS